MSRFLLILGLVTAICLTSVLQPTIAQDGSDAAAIETPTPTLKPSVTVTEEATADPEGLAAKASYLLGHNTIRKMLADLSAQGIDIDRQEMLKGIEGAISGKPSAYSQEEARNILLAYQKMMREKRMEEMARLSEENRSTGDAFRKENGAKENVTTLDNGIQYEVLTKGDGPKPAETDLVKIDYTGMFVDGTVFDTSLKSKQGQPPKPMELFASGYAIVNGNRVGMIKAFGIVLPMMNVGSKWKVVIPPELAYQVRGQGPIGPNETLVFEIEMKEIVEQSAKE